MTLAEVLERNRRSMGIESIQIDYHNMKAERVAEVLRTAQTIVDIVDRLDFTPLQGGGAVLQLAALQLENAIVQAVTDV